MTAESKGRTKYGVTKFSDLTEQEFSQMYLLPKGFLKKEKQNQLLNFTLNNSELKLGKDFFDWRFPSKEGTWPVDCLTNIYNQGACGSCWAFSATEQIEVINCIQGHTPGRKAEGLSMQQIVDCAHDGVYGCDGGQTYLAYEYVMAQGGIDLYRDYPYVGHDEACRFNPRTVRARVNGWGWITREDQEAVMRDYLFEHAPMSICVDASQWMNYHGGIVLDCERQIDHCVQITGYWIIDKVACWAVRNSWGSNWGVDGYIYLEFGHDVCALGQMVTSVSTA